MEDMGPVFTPLEFLHGLVQLLIDAGFNCPTPFQACAWPVLMQGRDVIGVAKAGSGRALGFVLPGYIKAKFTEIEGVACDCADGPLMLVIAPALSCSDISTRWASDSAIPRASRRGVCLAAFPNSRSSGG